MKLVPGFRCSAGTCSRGLDQLARAASWAFDRHGMGYARQRGRASGRGLRSWLLGPRGAGEVATRAFGSARRARLVLLGFDRALGLLGVRR